MPLPRTISILAQALKERQTCANPTTRPESRCRDLIGHTHFASVGNRRRILSKIKTWLYCAALLFSKLISGQLTFVLTFYTYRHTLLQNVYTR